MSGGSRALYRLAIALVSISLSACSVLPASAPDAPKRASRAVKVKDARGPLSAAQVKATLGRMSALDQPRRVLDRHLAIEQELAGTALSAGNQVTLLHDGPATYRAMLAAIGKASKHINMETYIFDDDEVGQAFARALIEKQRQGVQVHLIHDSAGTFGTPAAFFEQLTESGIRVLPFNPVNPLKATKEWTVNQRDHRKLLIVDGKLAILGGINISRVYSGSGLHRSSRISTDASLRWRDTDVQVQGPVVADFQKHFLASWRSQHGPEPDTASWFPPLANVGNDIVRAIGSRPDDGVSPIYTTLISAINAAERHINITNAYFVPDPQLLNALEAAALRGVQVRLLLPSQTDSWLTFHAGRRYYSQLLAAGVRIYERRDVVLHAKTVSIDGVWSTVGSSNLDWRSFLHNQELNAVILSIQFVQQLQQAFDRDLAESDMIELAQWHERPVDVRFKEWFAGVWEYWL